MFHIHKKQVVKISWN